MSHRSHVKQIFIFLIGVLLVSMAVAQEAIPAVQQTPRYNSGTLPYTAETRARILAWMQQHVPTNGGTPITESEARQNRAAWTVLVYSAADNDLEQFLVLDINEMEAVGSTSAVNFVVQVDRAEGNWDGDGDWTEARRRDLTKDQGPDV